MKTLFVLAFLLCISVGYGLECYQCFTIQGWDDCVNNTVQVTCQSGQDRCAKGHVEGTRSGVRSRMYVKGCAFSSHCLNDDNCEKAAQAVADPSVTINKCEISCCSGDLCNGAQVPMVSAIMLLACALVAVFH